MWRNRLSGIPYLMGVNNQELSTYWWSHLKRKKIASRQKLLTNESEGRSNMKTAFTWLMLERKKLRVLTLVLRTGETIES